MLIVLVLVLVRVFLLFPVVLLGSVNGARNEDGG
jgi:hypothetical protein